MVRTGHIFGSQHFAVAEAGGSDPLEESQDRQVRVGAIGRSGPRISLVAMVACVDGVVEIECLIAELLTKLQSLGDREGHGELRFLSLLFAIDLSPLGLIPRSWTGTLLRRNCHIQIVRRPTANQPSEGRIWRSLFTRSSIGGWVEKRPAMPLPEKGLTM